MRIVLNASYDHPANQGGVSTFNRNIIKIFSEEDIKILAYKTAKKKLFDYKINGLIEIYPKNRIFRSIDSRIFNYRIRDFLTRRIMKKLNPQVCIFNSPTDLERMANIKKVKKILVQHIDFDSYLKIYKINKIEFKKLIEKLDLFICLSEYDKQRFSEELEITEEKFKVIRHTCGIEILEEKKEKDKNLVMIARLNNHQKRFDLAIKAMKKLPDFTLKIYGIGNTELLKKIIRENDINNVFLCGPTNNVKEKLDMAGIFVMTSDYEGYGITNIEAMRRGLPIILRDTYDAARDVVVNNKNGILLEKEWDEDKFVEAIKKIYNNYEWFSENSKKLGERYDLKLIAKEWKKILNNLNKDDKIE